MDDTMHELVALSDTEQTVSDADEDIRGYAVKDADGEDLGKVDDLLIDTREKRVRFLVIASGGFLGLGEQKTFLPVDAVSRIADKEVRVDQTRDRLASAPAYDPDLVHDRDYNESIFSYYGYAPFWAPGYAYPGYPHYR